MAAVLPNSSVFFVNKFNFYNRFYMMLFRNGVPARWIKDRDVRSVMFAEVLSNSDEVKSHLKRCFFFAYWTLSNSLFLLTVSLTALHKWHSIYVKTWWFTKIIKSAEKVHNKSKVMTCIEQEHHSFQVLTGWFGPPSNCEGALVSFGSCHPILSELLLLP